MKKYPVLVYRGVPIKWLADRWAWAVNFLGLYTTLAECVARIDRFIAHAQL